VTRSLHGREEKLPQPWKGKDSVGLREQCLLD
jgi:hypothetical protein